MATEHVTQGQRIARARHRKGWDQATLAEKIGRSVSWLSKVENGRMPLDRMSVVGQLAEVLGIEVAELTGQPYRHETPELDSGHAAVPGLRLALQHASLPSGVMSPAVRQPRTLQELEANVRLAEQLRQDAKFTALGEVLPAIITDVAAQHVGSPDLIAAASWDLCGVWLHEAQLDPAKDAALSAQNQIELPPVARPPHLS